jgi:hypothetical protein
MNWIKKAKSDNERISNNIERLEHLKKKVHELGYFVVSSQSGGHKALQEILDEQLVKGRTKVHDKLSSALIGENNSKVALDAPTRFQRIMVEAEKLIMMEIDKEKKALRELEDESDRKRP